MKTKSAIIAAVVLAAAVLGVTSYSSRAAEKSAVKTPLKIVVVNLREVFQKNKLNEEFDARTEQERNKALGEIEAITKQIDALKAQMKTRVVGSPDYMSLMSQALDQQGLLQAKKEYFQQSMDARQQRFTEDLYTKIKEIIADYAARNNVDLVLVKDEIQFPAASPSDLMLALSTRKVLYAASELDITEAILSELNAKAAVK
jgi:Skp family chaperone for outer membrane proteins